MINRLKNLLDYVSKVKKVCGKNKILDLFFTQYCLRIPYSIYLNLGFYNKTLKGRKLYLYNTNPILFKYNPAESSTYHPDKRVLIQKTLPYMHRKMIANTDLSYSDFEKFIGSQSSYFYKPAFGDCGMGIKKLFVDRSKSLVSLYKEIIDLPEGLLEETITQHKELDILAPTLLQTLRITVFKHKDGPKILFACLKSSRNKDAYVDNAYAGGIFADIDIETGRISTNAFCTLSIQDKLSELDPLFFTDDGVPTHPITGTFLKGFKIPYFHEAIALVLKISSDVDFYERRILGFDVAITENGPELIEVNTCRPGLMIWQIAHKTEPLRAKFMQMLEE